MGDIMIEFEDVQREKLMGVTIYILHQKSGMTWDIFYICLECIGDIVVENKRRLKERLLVV